MKRAALYMRVSSVDQHPETRAHSTCARWPPSAASRSSRSMWIVSSGIEARRPGLDGLMRDARRGRVRHVVLVWASDRIARSKLSIFWKCIDELNRLGVEFVSFREPIDTTAARWAAPSS